jgi:uncharacterized protein YjbI with pentapeptide repeats
LAAHDVCLMSMSEPSDDPKPDADFDGDVEWTDAPSACRRAIVRWPAPCREGRDFMFAELSRVDLTGADFYYWAMFHDAVLAGALMACCDLRGATFNGANLSEARLSGADLSGALYDEATVFPVAFNPKRANMVAKRCKARPRE